MTVQEASSRQIQIPAFELGRLAASVRISNSSLLGEMVSVFARFLDVDVAGIAVYDEGIQQPARQVRVIGPWTRDESERFLEQSRWSSSERVLAARLQSMPTGRVYRRDELMSEDEFRATRLYSDFQQPMGLGDQALCLFRRRDGLELLIGVNMLAQNGLIPEEQLRRMQSIAPLLARCWAEAWHREPQWLLELKPKSRLVLELVLDGLDDLQIAERTGLRYHCVRAHLKRLFRQAGVRSRLHLMQACQNNTAALTDEKRSDVAISASN